MKQQLPLTLIHADAACEDRVDVLRYAGREPLHSPILFLRGLALEAVLDAFLAANYVYVPLAMLLFGLSLVLRGTAMGSLL